MGKANRSAFAANLPAFPNTVKAQIAEAAKTSSSSYSGGSSLSIPTITPPAAVTQNPQAAAAFKQAVKTTDDNLTLAVNTGLADSITYAVRFGSVFLLIGAFLSLFIPNVEAKHGKETEPIVH